MMSNVTYKKLGEVVDTFRGLTYAKGDEVPFSSKGVLRSNNIDLATHALNFDEIKYLREDFVIPENRKIKKNSIFICMSNGSMQHLGKVAFVDKDYDYAFGGFMGLIVPHATINSKYVYYCLTAPNFLHQVLKSGHGANINNLKFTDIEEYVIPVPSLEDQQRIVRELDAIHAILDAKNTQLRELDNLAKAIFFDMFGDPITNEKGWEVKKISEVAPCKKYTGDISSKNGKFWLLNLDMVESNSGRIIDYVWAGKDEVGNSTTTFNEDYVLYSKLRPYLNKVVLPMSSGYCTTELLPLLPSKCLNRYYLAYLLRSKSFVEYISIKVAGAKMPRVTMDDFRGFMCPLPPLDLQQSFASKITAIEQQKELIRASIVETETLLAARRQHYFD